MANEQRQDIVCPHLDEDWHKSGRAWAIYTLEPRSKEGFGGVLLVLCSHCDGIIRGIVAENILKQGLAKRTRFSA